MGYTEKLEQIDAEIKAMVEADDFPEELQNEVFEELNKEAYNRALANFNMNFCSGIEQSEILEACPDTLRERLLEERLTPEEKEEGKRIRAQERIAQAEKAVAAAEADLKKAQAWVEEAIRRNKPEMLKHESDLVQCRKSQLLDARMRLAAAKVEAHGSPGPRDVNELAVVLKSEIADPDGHTDQTFFALVYKDGTGRLVFPSTNRLDFGKPEEMTVPDVVSHVRAAMREDAYRDFQTPTITEHYVPEGLTDTGVLEWMRSIGMDLVVEESNAPTIH